ncbi:MAG: CPBP family intramembrane metalloprotease [Rhabdochlamydiaceae bacterium]|nr:CPBP family intramembrane metalloprotease [Rhabdochlamydiaceae bacterium]
MSYIFARNTDPLTIVSKSSAPIPKTEGQLEGRAYSANISLPKTSEANRPWMAALQETFASNVASAKKIYDSISSEEAKFGTGLGLGVGLGTVSCIYQFAASSLGWIPSMKSMMLESLRKQGISIDPNSACLFQDYAAKVNAPYGTLANSLRSFSLFETLSATSRYLQLLAQPFYVLMGPSTLGKHTPFTLKLVSGGMYFDAAITEEIVWRGIFQDVLLKRLPQMILKTVAPGKEKLLDSKEAKIFRVVITAALFSIMHAPNRQVMSSAYVDRLQIPLTFVAGLLFGAIKESKLGLTGAIGAHLGLNTVGLAANLTMC